MVRYPVKGFGMTTQKLRRYTTLTSLIDIIRTETLTLLSPSFWTDKNDVYVMDQYKQSNPEKFKTLLALCFTEAEETFHHWNVFAGDSSGVCIVFNKDALIGLMEEERGRIRHRAVTYTDTNSRLDQYNIDDIPFLKRGGYNDEKEYRFIYENSIRLCDSLRIRITIGCIDKIVFSPRMPTPLFNSVSTVISMMKNMEDYEIPMYRSTLTDDYEWKSWIDAIANPGTEPKDHHLEHLLKDL